MAKFEASRDLGASAPPLGPSVEPPQLPVFVCVGHDHRSPGIDSQGHRSRSRARLMVTVSKHGNAVGLTSILDRVQCVFWLYFLHRRRLL